MSAYRISPEHDAPPEKLQIIRSHLNAYNTAQLGFWDAKPVAILIRDEQDQIIGGITGWTYYGWLAISFLWLREDLRGQGLGTRLLQAAEAEGLARGCQYVELDTFSFQAPEFYFKNGYETFAVLDDFPGEHKRYYFRKSLVNPD